MLVGCALIIANWVPRWMSTISQPTRLRAIGIPSPLELGWGGGGGGGVGDVAAVTLLPEKYAMPECVIVEIGMQTHLNCIKNNNESE